MKQAESTLLIEREEVRVSDWYLEPGEHTGEHRHGFDYVVVPITDGLLCSVAAEGVSEMPLAPGKAYFRKAGVEHDVINAGTKPLRFIEIELKDRPG